MVFLMLRIRRWEHSAENLVSTMVLGRLNEAKPHAKQDD